jgi:flagellar hook-associated protein 1 FlgK
MDGVFDGSPLNGIGYYEKVLDQAVRDFAEIFNEANKAHSEDPAWVQYYKDYALYEAELVNDPGAVPPMRPDDASFPGGAIPQFVDRPLFEPIPPDTVITAKNIRVAEAWKNLDYMLTTTKKLPVTDGDSVIGDTSNLEYMISLFEKVFDFTTGGYVEQNSAVLPGDKFYTGNFEQMFRSIGLGAANDAAGVDRALKANINVITGIEDLRNSLSSVSMDEEGVNLLRFQKSYAASARVMTTLDEALEVLINRTGIVGR